MKTWFPYHKNARFLRIWFCWTHIQCGLNYTPQDVFGYEIALLLPFITIAWADYNQEHKTETTPTINNGNL